MNCFPCFSSFKTRKSSSTKEGHDNEPKLPEAGTTTRQTDETEQSVKTFTFRELATATKNFRQECLLGEGGFGRVYKGTLQSTKQVVAVKQLDKHGLHGNKEFQAEVLSLGELDHPNLVKLIGYCADGDQRLLVYEFLSGGSLQDHLHEAKSDQEPMDWITRMQIAYGAAQGLDYLHDKVNPPVIYRDLKSSNILLDDELSPKLIDFGLHKLGPGTSDRMGLSSRVMGTYGYSAPEYTRGGDPTLKSDVYSFGVILLELITGRKAIDTTKPNDEQNLVSWAQPIFRDPKRYPDMADPILKKNFSERGLNQAVAIASMCVQEEATTRPLISDVMVALSFLSLPAQDGVPTAVPILSFKDKSMSIALSRHDSPGGDEEEDDSSRTSSASSGSSEEEEKSSENMKSVSKKKMKQEDEDSAEESDSNSDDEHEKEQDVKKNAAQSLKIEYRYSWEDVNVNDERLSSKSSHESSEESTSSRYESDGDHDEAVRNSNGKIENGVAEDKEEEEEEEEEEIRHELEHVHSSKSEDQSVYSDADSRDDNGDSLHRVETN